MPARIDELHFPFGIKRQRGQFAPIVNERVLRAQVQSGDGRQFLGRVDEIFPEARQGKQDHDEQKQPHRRRQHPERLWPAGFLPDKVTKDHHAQQDDDGQHDRRRSQADFFRGRKVHGDLVPHVCIDDRRKSQHEAEHVPGDEDDAL